MYLLVDYITRFFNPLFNIIGQLSILKQQVAANKVFEMLESQPEEKEDGKLSSFNGNISFRNVIFLMTVKEMS